MSRAATLSVLLLCAALPLASCARESGARAGTPPGAASASAPDGQAGGRTGPAARREFAPDGQAGGQAGSAATVVSAAQPGRAAQAARAERAPGPFRAVVDHVDDGDTLSVRAGGEVFRIRLAGVDAPEFGQRFGLEARNRLRALVFDREVDVRATGVDRYGRLLACPVVDAQNVCETMVAEGWAWQYRQYSNDPRLAALEAQAREARRGLWSDPDARPPWERRAEERGRAAPGRSGARRPGRFTATSGAGSTMPPAVPITTAPAAPPCSRRAKRPRPRGTGRIGSVSESGDVREVAQFIFGKRPEDGRRMVCVTIRSWRRIRAMIVIHVHAHVSPDAIEAFRDATVRNATDSVQEPGIARFDVIQQQDDPTRFVLVEVYRSAEAVAAHKQTAHYATWRDAVAPLMAEPRAGVKYLERLPWRQWLVRRGVLAVRHRRPDPVRSGRVRRGAGTCGRPWRARPGGHRLDAVSHRMAR